jgi:hypothetical protein
MHSAARAARAAEENMGRDKSCPYTQKTRNVGRMAIGLYKIKLRYRDTKIFP